MGKNEISSETKSEAEIARLKRQLDDVYSSTSFKIAREAVRPFHRAHRSISKLAANLDRRLDDMFASTSSKGHQRGDQTISPNQPVALEAGGSISAERPVSLLPSTAGKTMATIVSPVDQARFQ